MQPRVSGDGSTVVFISPASDISPDGQGESFGTWVYLKSLLDGSIQRVPYATADDPSKGETPTSIAVNRDGSVVVILSIIGLISTPNEPGVWELTRYDRAPNRTTLIDTGVTGNKFNPSLSDDGRFVVFENQVGDFSGHRYSYLYDFESSELTVLNDGLPAQYPRISGDGRTIVFGDNGSFPLQLRLRDRVSGLETALVRGIDDQPANGMSDFPALSRDGRFVAFLSTASNLVADDVNGLDDIFVLDRARGTTTQLLRSSAPHFDRTLPW